MAAMKDKEIEKLNKKKIEKALDKEAVKSINKELAQYQSEKNTLTGFAILNNRNGLLTKLLENIFNVRIFEFSEDAGNALMVRGLGKPFNFALFNYPAFYAVLFGKPFYSFACLISLAARNKYVFKVFGMGF